MSPALSATASLVSKVQSAIDAASVAATTALMDGALAVNVRLKADATNVESPAERIEKAS